MQIQEYRKKKSFLSSTYFQRIWGTFKENKGIDKKYIVYGVEEGTVVDIRTVLVNPRL